MAVSYQHQHLSEERIPIRYRKRRLRHTGAARADDEIDILVCGILEDLSQRKIICADIELVKQPKPMPKLPVARIMYRHKPNFEIGTAFWCYAGGAHHSVVSTALTRKDIAMFAKLTGTEFVAFGDDTTEADLEKFAAESYRK